MKNNLSYFGKETDKRTKLNEFFNFLKEKLTAAQLNELEADGKKNFKTTQIKDSNEYIIEQLNYFLKYISESSLSQDLKNEIIIEIKKIKDVIDPPNYTLYIISAIVLLLIILLAFFLLKKK